MAKSVGASCDYYQFIELGQTYYVYNTGYPNSYRGENHCTWTTESPYTLRVNCTVDMPSVSSVSM